MNFLSGLINRLFPKPRVTTAKMYVPDGFAEWSTPCYMCGEMPMISSDHAHVIWHGKPVCESCFWSDEWLDEHHPKQFEREMKD